VRQRQALPVRPVEAEARTHGVVKLSPGNGCTLAVPATIHRAASGLVCLDIAPERLSSVSFCGVIVHTSFFVPTRDTRTLPADFELSQDRRTLQDSLTLRHAVATFTTPAPQASGRLRVMLLISTESGIFKPLLK